jgi:hypothetical protein
MRRGDGRFYWAWAGADLSFMRAQIFSLCEQQNVFSYTHSGLSLFEEVAVVHI